MVQKIVRLLIVDDDDDDIYLIKDALSEVEGTSYQVTSVNSALAAMVKLASETYDVIISDYRLNHGTGIEFIKSVRVAGIDTPIVLLTGLAGQLIDNEALAAGASDFLPKASLNAAILDRSLRYAVAHADRQRLLHAVLKTTVSGMAVLNAAGELTLWNPRFVEFADAVFSEDKNKLSKLAELAVANAAKDITIGPKTVEVHCMSLPDTGVVLALHDVTARVNELRDRAIAEQRIRKIAMHDALTGLPNRLALNERLEESLAVAAIEHQRLAILSLDFNRFKEVNDLFGHAAGDELLRAGAARLAPLLTGKNYAARQGGDEFVLIHECTSDTSAIDLARRIADALSQSIDWQGKIIDASVSIGLSYFPDHGTGREQLLANADLAMYRAKADMTSAVCVFDADMDEFVRGRRKIAHELRSAPQNNELKLCVQPQFELAGGRLSGFEFLLRWHTAARGFVSPDKFIPVAEETGMIKEIDDWVLRESCALAARMNLPVKAAVNVSARGICHPDIIATVRSALIETGMSPKRLEIEVTETALISDLSRALYNLRQIKAMGVAIAMDDFGTGYSSLSLLSSFPFDRIKIDRSFICSAEENPRVDSIFRAMTSMGKAMGVPVLVEGVETEEQLKICRRHECDEVQGYLTGRPFPAEEIDEYLRMVPDLRSIGTRHVPLGMDTLDIKLPRHRGKRA